MTEPRWALPDTSIADLTFAEILAERAEAKEASDAWLYERDVVQRRRDDVGALRGLAQFAALADWLGSDRAAEVLRVLIGTDPGAFLDNESEFAPQVVGWYTRRRRLNRFQARDLARPLVAALEARHDAIWRAQARTLLAANEHLAGEHPRLYRLAATLAAGNLAMAEQIATLDTPLPDTRPEIQKLALGDYPARRSVAVDRAWAALSRRDRHRTSRNQLAAACDDENLLVCAVCRLAYPLEAPGDTHYGRCAYCDGSLLRWVDRDAVVPVAERLRSIRKRLANVATT